MGKWALGAFVILVGLFLSQAAVAQERRVAINEIAWGGTVADPLHEWIELYNPTDQDISLEQWKLASSDGGVEILLSGKIAAFGFFLLARSAGEESLHPDLVYRGALTDAGEALWLVDPEGRVVDTANREGGGWPAGTNEWGNPPCCSMERIDPTSPDARSNWATHGSDSAPTAGTEGVCGSPGRVNSVYNLVPRVGFSFSPDPAHPGETVLFDAARSIDPNGVIRSFQWDFGDGTTAVGEAVGHSFPEARVYSVTLTTTDDQNASSSLSRPVRVVSDQPLLVDFSVRTASVGQIPRSLDRLEFIDESYDPDDPLAGWLWNFGDGATAVGEKAIHAFNHSGTYTVTLEVTGQDGATGAQSQAIQIEPPLPVARFTYSPPTPSEQVDTFFDGGQSLALEGAIVRYEWDFDADGLADVTSTQTGASHVFAEGGSHAVSLYVVDDAGGASPWVTQTLYINRRPTAAFQVSSLFPIELDPVLFTDQSGDAEGPIVAWLWNFGDGTSSSSPSQTHAYTDAGVYKVVLTVTDVAGAEGQATAEITVQNLLPFASLSANGNLDYLAVLTGESVLFDASQSRDPSPAGRIVRYDLDLAGDGTYGHSTTTATLTYSYQDEGAYAVRVRVTDDDGATAISAPVTVMVSNRPPTGTFAWTPSPSVDGVDVTFRPISCDVDGTVVQWSWSFGDGTGATVESPIHRFQASGVYDVTLVLTDEDGSSGSVTQQVAVENAPPVAAFNLVPSAPRVGDVVLFTDRSYDPSPTGQIVHVAWNFGDGTTCPGQESSCGGGSGVSHAYSAPGTYTVELVVIDNLGALARVTRAVIVAP